MEVMVHTNPDRWTEDGRTHTLTPKWRYGE